MEIEPIAALDLKIEEVTDFPNNIRNWKEDIDYIVSRFDTIDKESNYRTSTILTRNPELVALLSEGTTIEGVTIILEPRLIQPGDIFDMLFDLSKQEDLMWIPSRLQELLNL